MILFCVLYANFLRRIMILEMEMDENTLSEFLNKYPENTKKAYLRAIQSFENWYRFSFGEQPDYKLVTSVEIKDYMAHLQVKHLSAASVNLHLAAIRALIRHHGRSLRIRGPRQTRPPIHALSVRDVGRLLAAAENNPRDYAILNLMARAGLRVGEVVSLEVSDIELKERSGWITIRQGKGNKTRRVPLGLEARKAVQAWMKVRPFHEAKVLFTSRSGKALTARDIQRLVYEYARRAKLRDITPHVLRHTFATRAIESGMDLATLQAILGHESISTTSRYLHPTEARMAEMVENL